MRDGSWVPGDDEAAQHARTHEGRDCRRCDCACDECEEERRWLYADEALDRKRDKEGLNEG